MEKSFQKFLKGILSEEYPNVLDVDVIKTEKFTNFYDVRISILGEDWAKYVIERDIRQYIRSLSKYMNLSILHTYVNTFDKDEWEEMKSRKEY